MLMGNAGSRASQITIVSEAFHVLMASVVARVKAKNASRTMTAIHIGALTVYAN